MIKLKDITKIDVFTDLQEVDNLIEFLAHSNDRKFNCAKFAEELNELAAEVLKVGNKQVEHHPEDQQIIDELGDIMIRMKTFCTMHFKDMMSLEDAVNERIVDKANKLLGYIKEGKYNKGV